mgnify:CR=1 FL=1|jgi:hypothetical protein|tara:strand:- start:2930 stop:3148 length:219 start_codon:yes stop_codon:yes gene_type:complete
MAIPRVSNGIENPEKYKFKIKNGNIDLYVGNNESLNGSTLVSIKNKNQNTGKIIDSQMNPKDFYEKIISLGD